MICFGPNLVEMCALSPDLVYFTTTRYGLFHYEPDLVYFSRTRCGLFHYEPDLVYFTTTRRGLFYYEPTSLQPDVVYFTVNQMVIFPGPDVVCFIMSQIWSTSL